MLKLIKKIYGLIRKALCAFLIGGVRFYQKFLSPVKSYFHYGHCPFTPCCSQYAIEALRKYGPFKGTYLAVRRLLRCHPFTKGGYDPVP